MDKLWIHTGYPKTATSFLQQNLFGKHSEINNLARPFGVDGVAQDLLRNIKYSSKLSFSKNSVEKLIKNVKSETINSKINLISDEDLVGFFEVTVNPGIIAERLQELLPEAEILITIRNQYSFLPSAYSQWVKGVPNRYKYVTFEEWLSYAWYRYQNGFNNWFERINYWPLINQYLSLFGRDSVRLTCYEWIREKQSKYIGKLCNHFGINKEEITRDLPLKPSNERLSTRESIYRRVREKFPLSVRFSNFMPSFMESIFRDWLTDGGSLDLELTDKWKKRTRSIAAEGNNKLRNEFQISPERFDYPL